MTPRRVSLPCTVGEHVALARRDVRPGLVSDAAWSRLDAIADPLPVVARDAGLEIRLGAADPRVDLEICLESSLDERRRVAGSLREAATQSSAWRRVRAFVQAWAIEGSLLDRVVPGVWLEFDTDGEGTPEPFVLVALDREELYPDGTADGQAVRDVALSALDLLADGLDAETRANVERILAQLPANAALRHLAVRPTAAGDVARLVLQMPWRRVAKTLRDLGWPGDASDLYATCERLCPDTFVHMVNIDVLPDGLGPRVGIEILHPGAPRENPRWAKLFDTLEALGACAPERRAAIEDWGGERTGADLGPGAFGVQRDLLVKVVHEPGRALAAKAYLAFAPRLLARAELEDAPA